MRLLGVPHRHGVWPVQAEGDEQIRRVNNDRWRADLDGRLHDVLACGFGLVPNVELPLALGCALNDGFVRVGGLQETSVRMCFAQGEPTGVGGADCAVEGQIAGWWRAGDEILVPAAATWHQFRAAHWRKAFA